MDQIKYDEFKIYVEQLRDGRVEKINAAFDPEFLGIQEKELAYRNPIVVQGQAYLANDTLVIHCTIKTFAIIPCSICNEPVKVEISINNFYHAEPLSEISTGVFDLQEAIRQAVVLETPAFAECNSGKCEARSQIKKYLKSAESSGKDADGNEGYHPFADLKIDKKPKL